MSDGALTQEEINELLSESEAEKSVRKKKWILENIKIIKELNIDELEDQLMLDILFNAVKETIMIKNRGAR